MSRYLPSDLELLAKTPDHCGCLKLRGQVGGNGWHYWVVTRDYLEFKQKVNWRKQNPAAPTSEFIYDSGGEAAYLGTVEACERCPAYSAAVARSTSERDEQGHPIHP